MTQVLDIPLSQIEVRKNVRLEQGDKYHELVQSMHERGQLVPIQVYADGSKWVVQYGHLRFLAAQELGWKTIQATEVVPPENEAVSLVNKTHENIARSDMSYMELAQVYEDLVQQGMKAQEVADMFNVSKTTVSVARATLKADPKIRKAVEEGKISPTAAEVLVFKPPEVQEVLADAAISAKTTRKVKAVLSAYERSGTIPNVDREVEETVFETDPLLETYLEQIREAQHLLRSVHPEWLDTPCDLFLDDDFRALAKEWDRINQECENE